MKICNLGDKNLNFIQNFSTLVHKFVDLTIKMSKKSISQSTNPPDKKTPQVKIPQTPFAGGAFKDVSNPLWLSISEAAKLGGVQAKTIRRAIQSNTVKYKVIKNRYLVDFASVIIYLYSKKKLRNKLIDFGVGQYIEKWREE